MKIKSQLLPLFHLILRFCPSFLSSGFLTFLVMGTGHALAMPVHTPHLELELVASGPALPGQTVVVALRQKILSGWHTYWRNPGDAGESTTLSWSLPENWQAGPIDWPAPERVMTGSLMNYVYSDVVFLPSTLTIPKTARPGTTAHLSAHASLLVCKDVCVPEEADVTLNLPIGPQMEAVTDKQKALAETLNSLPKTLSQQAWFRIDKGRILLRFDQKGLEAAANLSGDNSHKKILSAYFYPFRGSVIAQAKPQELSWNGGDLILSIPGGYDIDHGQRPENLEGLISFQYQNAGLFSFGATTRDHAFNVIARRDESHPGETTLASSQQNLPSLPTKPPGFLLNFPILALAFLGGIILNFMPCVFPVLAMKAAYLVKQGVNRSSARQDGLAYLAGVVISFLSLALGLELMKRTGTVIGWGFQLQSPAMVAGLALVILTTGLNLSGLFEFGYILPPHLSGPLVARSGPIGAFFAGVLAVFLASPCMGPFMASALGWGLTQPFYNSLFVFISLGLGLAAPFMFFAFFPGLFRFLPKPGAWMDRLRQFLAIPMYATFIWLLWVLSQEIGVQNLPVFLGAAIVLILGFWVLGKKKRLEKSEGFFVIGWILIGLAFTVGTAFPLVVKTNEGTSLNSSGTQAVSQTDLTIRPWSAATVKALQTQHKPIFVDFTADWCVTCKWNEVSVLQRLEVVKAFQHTGTAYLRADWTRADPAISAELSLHNHPGVPLYLIYDRHGGPPKILPQILDVKTVLAALAEGG